MSTYCVEICTAVYQESTFSRTSSIYMKIAPGLVISNALPARGAGDAAVQAEAHIYATTAVVEIRGALQFNPTVNTSSIIKS